jgi:Flp pilus assembly protein TadB
MNALPWIVSILAAMITFIVTIMAYRLARMRRDASMIGVKAAASPNWEDWLAPYLALVPVPMAIIQRWGEPHIEKELIHAGIDWSERDYVAFRWVGLWLAAGVAILLGFSSQWSILSQFLALLIMLVAFFGPPIWLGWRRQRRCETIDIVLPNFLDRLNLSMEAGLGFEIALRRTSENFPGLLGHELRKLVRAVDRGHTRFEALDQFVERTPSNDLAAFVTAVKQSDRLGTSLAKTLRIQSQILRARRRRRAEEAGRRLPILIVFPLVFFFLPALLIIYLAPPMLHLFLGR